MQLKVGMPSKPAPDRRGLVCAGVVHDQTEATGRVRTDSIHSTSNRIVADIDDIVMRKTLVRYKLHIDEDLFDKAYGYIRQYY